VDEELRLVRKHSPLNSIGVCRLATRKRLVLCTAPADGRGVGCRLERKCVVVLMNRCSERSEKCAVFSLKFAEEAVPMWGAASGPCVITLLQKAVVNLYVTEHDRASSASLLVLSLYFADSLPCLYYLYFVLRFVIYFSPTLLRSQSFLSVCLSIHSIHFFLPYILLFLPQFLSSLILHDSYSFYFFIILSRAISCNFLSLKLYSLFSFCLFLTFFASFPSLIHFFLLSFHLLLFVVIQFYFQSAPVHSANWRMVSSGLFRRVGRGWTHVSEVPTRATRRNNPEDTIFHSHRRENLKSYIQQIV
jgi:hypothetical protein